MTPTPAPAPTPNLDLLLTIRAQLAAAHAEIATLTARQKRVWAVYRSVSYHAPELLGLYTTKELAEQSLPSGSEYEEDWGWDTPNGDHLHVYSIEVQGP